MHVSKPDSAAASKEPLDDGPPIAAPLSWRLRELWRKVRFPLIGALILLGIYYVPILEARRQQNDLAAAFFEECRKTLKDTDQLPKTPDEMLEIAIRKGPLTDSAVSAWAPLVTSEIRNKEWIARIEFHPPHGYAVEETIGPALAEAGYDTPSAGP